MAVHRNDKLHSSFGVDTTDLQAFVKDLKRASPAAAKGIRTVVKTAAEIVAAEARADVSQHSRSIPPTIKARTYLSGSRRSAASVTAGKGVPLAALYELGNKGAKGSATTFDHPVYERSSGGSLQRTAAWTTQARYPFLLPAAERKAPEVQAALVAIADTVAKILEVRKL